MSLFDDIFGQAGLPQLLATSGEEIVIEPADAQPITLTALVAGEETRESPKPTGGLERHRTRTITFLRDPDSEHGGYASPHIGLVVKVGADEYRLKSIDSMTDVSARVNIARPELAEKTKPNYRK